MGFGDDHVPLLKIAKSQKHQQMPVTFPSRKAAQKTIRARSPLMRDALIHLETNPDVVRIAAYPVRIQYEIADRYSVIASLDHIPQVDVWTRQEQASYFDIIPVCIQQENRWIASRTSKLKKAFWEEYRATYAVLDENSLHIQPRMMNLATIRYHAYRVDEAAVMAVRRALLSVPAQTTVQAITDAAALPDRAHVFYNEDGSVAQCRVLTEVKRTFSAVMWLVVEGELKIDLSGPLSPLSAVSRTTSQIRTDGRAA